MNRTRTTRLAAVAMALALLLLAACGSDDSDSAADPAGADGGSDGTAASDEATVEVTAVDFAFEDLPSTVDAGTSFTLVNDSDSELHELVAFRLPDDEERSVDELMELPPDELMGALGGEPELVLLTPPDGEMVVAVGDGSLDEPGRYAVICVIPTGADPDEYLAAAAESEGGPPEVDGGPPHIAHGMFAELTVR